MIFFLYEDEEIKRKPKLPSGVKWEVSGKGKCNWCDFDCHSHVWSVGHSEMSASAQGEGTQKGFLQTLVPAVI